MGKLNEAVPITLPVPTSGISRAQPLAKMDPAFSPWILNYDCETRSCKVRNGYVVFSRIGPTSPLYLIEALGVWGAKAFPSNNKLFAYVDDGVASGFNKVYDVQAGSVAYTLADDTSDEAYPVNFLGRLGFLVETDQVDCQPSFDGSTWGAWNITTPGRGGVAFKNRLFTFYGMNLYYGTLGQVTGTLTAVDLTKIFDGGSSIAWASVMSSPGERASEVYLAIGNDDGEVIVYSGDWPDADNWQLIGRFRTSAPLGYNSILKYKNDTWILTETGVVSLRALFSVGADATLESSPSFEISDYWTKLMAALTVELWGGLGISGIYWPEKNQIRILVPGYLDESDTFDGDIATMLVYNTITQAWSFHSLATVDTSRLGCLTYYQNNIYFMTQNIIMTVSATLFKDEQWDAQTTYYAYDTSLQGAFSAYGQASSNKKVVGFQPILKTDFNGTDVTMKAVADMGRQNSDAAAVELVDGYNLPYYSVGAEGTFLQYKLQGISDITSTDGLEVFAVTAFIVAGGRG